MVGRFVETTRKGWFSRIGDSFGGALLGILLFLVAFPLLFWNEGRAVRRAQDLEHGAESVVALSDKPNAANDGKLVHVTGAAKAMGAPVDQAFGVTAAGALALERNVTMYQWKETKSSRTKKKVGGSEETTTEYDYEKVWSGSAIDSSHFRKTAGHQNPGAMPYDSVKLPAKEVKLGGFTLSPTFLDKLSPDKALAVTDARLPAGAQLSSGAIYIGTNPASPQIGDVRIAYTTAPEGAVSVIGGQHQSKLIAYTDADMSGDIALIERGNVGPTQMFKAAQDANFTLTWVLRFVGWLLMFLGLRLAARPLAVIADIIPFIGSGVSFATGFVIFFVTLALSGVTIAVAWIFYRPLLAILIIAGAFAAMVVGVMIARKRSA